MGEAHRTRNIGMLFAVEGRGKSASEMEWKGSSSHYLLLMKMNASETGCSVEKRDAQGRGLHLWIPCQSAPSSVLSAAHCHSA